MSTVGSVYILENSRVPGIVKVGRTDNIDRRLSELNSHAGVAGRWRCAGYITVSDCVLAENLVHQALRDVWDRQSGGTEMFNCSVDHAGLAFSEALEDQDSIEIYKDELPATVRELLELREMMDEKRRIMDEEKAQKRHLAENEKLQLVVKAKRARKLEWLEIGFICLYSVLIVATMRISYDPNMKMSFCERVVYLVVVVGIPAYIGVVQFKNVKKKYFSDL